MPEGSPWTCPQDDVFDNASTTWGVLGPTQNVHKIWCLQRDELVLPFWSLAPIPGWFLSRKYPNIKWLGLIHMPIVIGATTGMPPTSAVNYWAWEAVRIFFNFYVYRKFKAWWARHTFVLSAAFDAGVAFSGVLVFFTLQ